MIEMRHSGRVFFSSTNPIVGVVAVISSAMPVIDRLRGLHLTAHFIKFWLVDKTDDCFYSHNIPAYTLYNRTNIVHLTRYAIKYKYLKTIRERLLGEYRRLIGARRWRER